MELLLDRKYKKSTYSIGKLYVNGEYFCDTVEDKDRGLTDSMAVEEIKKKKVYALTAIPLGRYRITMNVISPSFSKKSYYKNFCNGRLPRLLNVVGFDGILIHRGSNADSSSGCIIVGKNTVVGGVTQSQQYFEKLWKLLDDANKKGEEIWITIK